MSGFSDEARQHLEDYLNTHYIPKGLGTKEKACSIAAINLAISGKLTDNIPECMSPVIGSWIIKIQDSMPDYMRNSNEWKRLLVLAAGTGRDKEVERIQLIIDWMWSTVLPTIQYIAESKGFGLAWKNMLDKRTFNAAYAAADAAADTDAADAADAAYTAAAVAADVAADAADAAAVAAVYTADAADADAANAVAYAADAAAYANAVAYAADAAAYAAWDSFDIFNILEKLISITI